MLVLNHISETIISADHIKEWTNKDPVLSQLRNLVLTAGQIPTDVNGLSPYTHCFCELSVADCCVLRGSRVIVPPPGHSLLLSQLHEGHRGITRMKNLARSYFWWPGMDRAIEDTVRKCDKSQEHGNFPLLILFIPGSVPKLHGHVFTLTMLAHS